MHLHCLAVWNYVIEQRTANGTEKNGREHVTDGVGEVGAFSLIFICRACIFDFDSMFFVSVCCCCCPEFRFKSIVCLV